ncbi:MAG: hypothetical protein K6C13_16075 [Oscillospiraceae bacterium]|nr:hypothetical protein [Oscillospiraceae bacterium]
MKRSFKYRLLLKAFRILHAKKIMAAPAAKAQKIFKKAYKGENIPAMSDHELRITVGKVKGSAVVYYKHIKPCERLAIYLVGGGLLKYPQPAQARYIASLSHGFMCL